VDNPDGEMKQEQEMIQQGNDYREMSPRFAGSERGKEGSHCTTAEIPKSRRDDIRQQRERGGRGEAAGSKEKSDDI
jgi:hypothetical protein